MAIASAIIVRPDQPGRPEAKVSIRTTLRSEVRVTLGSAGAVHTSGMNCPHQPRCPSADAPDCEAAQVIAAHPEQGWSLLCNGVVVFDDTGDLLPDGHIIAPHRTPG